MKKMIAKMGYLFACAMLSASIAMSSVTVANASQDDDVAAKCGCGKTRGDATMPAINEDDIAKCGCGKTKGDAMMVAVDQDELQTVAACCDYCAQPGSFGCQGKNSWRCNTCQQGLVKMAATLASAQRRLELDEIPATRAAREALDDPCVSCVADPGSSVQADLQRLMQCCMIANCQLQKQGWELKQQGRDAKKCCKKLNRGITEIEELLVSIIDSSASCSMTEILLTSILDQTAACCSVTDGALGDPTTSSALDIPICEDLDIVSFVDNTSADLLTWVKSLVVLVFNTAECTCC